MSQKERQGVRESIKKEEGYFSFGDMDCKAVKSILIPCKVGKLEFDIRTVVVTGEVPWLLGRRTLERMRAKLLVDRNIIIGGNYGEIFLKGQVRGGHLKVNLRRGRDARMVWWEGGIDELKGNKLGREKVIERLHVQFGHPSSQRLCDLIIDAVGKEVGEEGRREIKVEVEKMSEDCEVCKRYSRTPSRPKAGMTLAKRFNEVVAIDLGELEGRRFIVMMDMGTGF